MFIIEFVKLVVNCSVSISPPKSKILSDCSFEVVFNQSINSGELGEYSNALLNYPTTKGRSIGIEGGFGFFGSIASDNLQLKIMR